MKKITYYLPHGPHHNKTIKLPLHRVSFLGFPQLVTTITIISLRDKTGNGNTYKEEQQIFLIMPLGKAQKNPNIRATTSIRSNFLSILQEKTYFFYFTHYKKPSNES